MNNLGNYHKHVAEDYQQMEKYRFMAIDKGNTDSIYNLIEFYIQNNNKLKELIINFINEKSTLKNENSTLQKKIKALEQENEILKDELHYRPGGAGQIQAHQDFISRMES